MNRKLFIGLAPLLAIAAFAMGPAAAQAAPHWYSNNVRLGEAEPREFAGWGTIDFTNPKNGLSVICHNTIAGFVENPVGGPAVPGVIHVASFAPYECESPGFICAPGPGGGPTTPGELGPAATDFEWAGELEEPKLGETRLKIGKPPKTPISEEGAVKVYIGCIKEKTAKLIGLGGGTSTQIQSVTGEIKPLLHHGTSALHPGYLEFAAGAGTLEINRIVEINETTEEVKEESLNEPASVEGEVKMLGYNEQELLNVKNP